MLFFCRRERVNGMTMKNHDKLSAQAEKVKEITEKLEYGIKELFESRKYEEYLRTLSKLHNYSFNNTVLISLQKPDASMVAGYTSWQANFHRNVKKGEQGIKILAPSPYKVWKEVEKTDPVTQNILLDKNGLPQTERVQVIILAYKVAYVYDVSQTEGEEIPEIATILKDEVQEYEKMFSAVKMVSPVPVELKLIEGNANGYYSQTEKVIVVKDGMSQAQTLKTAIHEVSHAILHDKDTGTEKEEQPDRRTKEVEAESVAYTVCCHLGLDTSDYSFGYIAGWSSGKELAELKASMNVIRDTASMIIRRIEECLVRQEVQEKKETAVSEKCFMVQKERHLPEAHHRRRR